MDVKRGTCNYVDGPFAYGKLEEMFSQVNMEQVSLEQRSGYYVPLEKTGGRTKFAITKEQLANLRETGLTWAKIATCVSVSERTLYRRGQEFDIDGRFSDLSNTELDELLKFILAVTPWAGGSYIRGSWRGSGLRTQLWRIRERLRVIDPWAEQLVGAVQFERGHTMCGRQIVCGTWILIIN